MTHVRVYALFLVASRQLRQLPPTLIANKWRCCIDAAGCQTLKPSWELSDQDSYHDDKYLTDRSAPDTCRDAMQLMLKRPVKVIYEEMSSVWNGYHALDVEWPSSRLDIKNATLQTMTETVMCCGVATARCLFGANDGWLFRQEKTRNTPLNWHAPIGECGNVRFCASTLSICTDITVKQHRGQSNNECVRNVLLSLQSTTASWQLSVQHQRWDSGE